MWLQLKLPLDHKIMDRLHQLSVNGVSMIKNCRTFNFNVSNVNFEINLRVGIISKFRESSFQSVFNSWAVINMHVLITAHELYIYYNFVKKTIHRNPLLVLLYSILCTPLEGTPMHILSISTSHVYTGVFSMRYNERSPSWNKTY